MVNTDIKFLKLELVTLTFPVSSTCSLACMQCSHSKVAVA